MKGTREAAGRGDGPGRLGSRKAKGESWRACVFEAKRKGCDYGEYFMEPEIGDYSAHSVSAALDECRAPSETAAGRESEAETETERERGHKKRRKWQLTGRSDTELGEAVE